MALDAPLQGEIFIHHQAFAVRARGDYHRPTSRGGIDRILNGALRSSPDNGNLPDAQE